MNSPKIYLPMVNKEYAVTESEQKNLACRYDLSIDEVRVLLLDLRGKILAGLQSQAKTANKTKLIIDNYFENSNVKVVRAL